jgi:hypothetical protein
MPAKDGCQIEKQNDMPQGIRRKTLCKPPIRPPREKNMSYDKRLAEKVRALQQRHTREFDFTGAR